MACQNIIPLISLSLFFICGCTSGDSKQHKNNHQLLKQIPTKQPEKTPINSSLPSPTETSTVITKPIEKPMISSITNGLAPEHLSQQPILDRISTHRHGQVEGVRTYNDGTQYMIFIDPSDPNNFEKPPTWNRFITVTPKGIQLLRSL